MKNGVFKSDWFTGLIIIFIFLILSFSFDFIASIERTLPLSPLMMKALLTLVAGPGPVIFMHK